MSSFLDGPAAGAELNLRRAPYLLRVVIDRETGKVDALDQLDDEPRAEEDVHVYVLMSPARVTFACRVGRGGHGGRFEHGIYRALLDQPPDRVVRDTDNWRLWATARGTELLAVAGSRA